MPISILQFFTSQFPGKCMHTYAVLHTMANYSIQKFRAVGDLHYYVHSLGWRLRSIKWIGSMRGSPFSLFSDLSSMSNHRETAHLEHWKHVLDDTLLRTIFAFLSLLYIHTYVYIYIYINHVLLPYTKYQKIRIRDKWTPLIPASSYPN